MPIRDQRWVIEHVSSLTTDEIARIRDLGVVVTTHTGRYLFKEGELLRSRVGAAAEESIVPLKSLRDAGVHVALATDNVPTSLFHPIWHAIARLDRSSGRAIAPSSSSREPGRRRWRRSISFERSCVGVEGWLGEPASRSGGSIAASRVNSTARVKC